MSRNYLAMGNSNRTSEYPHVSRAFSAQDSDGGVGRWGVEESSDSHLDPAPSPESGEIHGKWQPTRIKGAGGRKPWISQGQTERQMSLQDWLRLSCSFWLLKWTLARYICGLEKFLMLFDLIFPFKQIFKECLRFDSKTPHWDCDNKRSEICLSSRKEQFTWVLSFQRAHWYQKSQCLENTSQHRGMSAK